MIIEILQDGAAFLEKNTAVEAVYTEGFETCILNVFVGVKGTLVIHDSAQLCVNELNKLIKKCGKLIKITSISNSLYMKKSPNNLYYKSYGEEQGEVYRKSQLKKHQDRLAKIIKKLKCKCSKIEQYVSSSRGNFS